MLKAQGSYRDVSKETKNPSIHDIVNQFISSLFSLLPCSCASFQFFLRSRRELHIFVIRRIKRGKRTFTKRYTEKQTQLTTLGKNQKLSYDTKSKKRLQPKIWSRPKPSTGQLDMKYSLLQACFKISSPH